MSLFRLFAVTLKSLKSHIFRTILASLGVVLGVGSVVGMTSISEGARQTSLEQIKSLGINNIILTSENIQTASQQQGGGNNRSISYGITKEDLRHIKTFENVDVIVPVRDLKQKVILRGKKLDINLFGTTPEFLATSYSKLVNKNSRFFNIIDSKSFANVCVIGKEAARMLYNYKDPLGKHVNIGSTSYKIIGVIENNFGYELGSGKKVNKQILIPFSTAMETYGKTIVDTSNWKFYEIYAHKVNIRVKDVKSLVNTSARIKNYLKIKHDQNDYLITIPLELVKQQEKTQKVFTIVMGSIAAISLLVGGIGIMNIMLANIYERTREIGTRRALGATQSNIVLQFLCESTLMTGIGGGIGIAVGFAIANIVETYGGMTTIVSVYSVLISFSVSVATGIIFGTYPAYQASKLDPVVALRRE